MHRVVPVSTEPSLPEKPCPENTFSVIFFLVGIRQFDVGGGGVPCSAVIVNIDVFADMEVTGNFLVVIHAVTGTAISCCMVCQTHYCVTCHGKVSNDIACFGRIYKQEVLKAVFCLCLVCDVYGNGCFV